MRFLTLFKSKHKIQQDIKNRVLNNKEAVLNVMAENVKGAKSCESLLGQKCLGEFCEHFREYKEIDNATGETIRAYHECVYNKTADLLIEMIGISLRTNMLLERLIENTTKIKEGSNAPTS